jgi:alpha-galactosidase
MLLRTDSVTNQGDREAVVFGYAARIGFEGSFLQYTQANHWTGENQGCWEERFHGVRELCARGGRTCLGATPYTVLRERESGVMVAVHLLAGGDWSIRTEACGETLDAPYLILVAGPVQDELAYPLAPGETVRFSSLLFQSLPGGSPESGAPALHRYLLQDPAYQNRKTMPVEYNTWFYNFDTLDEQELLKQLDAAADLGCEVFTVDAGWYGQLAGPWYRQTGDWREKQDGAFCGTMRRFADTVRSRGLTFGVWMEPERFEKNAPPVLAHPEWFYEDPGDCLCIDLDQEEAARYFKAMIREVIDRYGAGWLKVDFNHSLGRDPRGKAHLGYTGRFRRIMEELREQYPSLILECCSSGGMRFEIETQKHFDISFMSDTVNSFDVLRIGEGASLRVLYSRIMLWCCFEPALDIPRYGSAQKTPMTLQPLKAIWDRAELVDPDFALKVCLTGHLGFSGELAALDDTVKTQIKKAVAFCKRFREPMRRSVRYLLTPVRPIADRSGWSVDFCYNEEEDIGIIHAFRLDSPLHTRTFLLPLEGEGDYRVEDYDTGKIDLYSAQKLRRTGLDIVIPKRYCGIIVVLTGVPAVSLCVPDERSPSRLQD